ncbi:MAG: hypothetical protein A2046_15655 [Bacteroidetes bacterium GWA2_30_7]|nr:MAG: hypothetical protein A2046_15655 [Bacteroidetes bacterium GWA2_30_7]
MKLSFSRYTSIGLVVVIAIIGLVWGFNFLKGRNLFVKENTYSAIYGRIDGLEKSSAVMLNGLKIGQVRDIKFLNDNSGKIIVDFAIKDEIKLNDSAVALIVSMDLMGTKSIELIQGKSTKYHKIGDTLKSKLEFSIKDQVSIQMLPLKLKAEELMLSLDSVLAVFTYIFNENTKDNISKTFTSIKMTIQNLEKTSVSLDTIMQTEKGKLSRIFSNIELISSNLRNNNEQISLILTNFSNISDTIVKADIGKTIRNANKALSDIDLMLGKIKRGEGTIGMLANNDTLYNNLETATLNLNKLLIDIQKNPKRYAHFSLFDFGGNSVDKEKKETKN